MFDFSEGSMNYMHYMFHAIMLPRGMSLITRVCSNVVILRHVLF